MTQMPEYISLRSNDATIDAYRTGPMESPKAGLIVLQELFGVNEHIRAVADSYASKGYQVVAPALFDRVEKDVQLGYTSDDMAKGRELRSKITWDMALADIDAAKAAFRPGLKVGVLGFCWGGAIAWLAATRLNGLSAVVSYYGAGIGNFAAENPRCPTQLHFGEQDHFIPLDDVAKVQELHPDSVEAFVYPAGHGFNCDRRASYHAESAQLARTRVVAFLSKTLG